VRSGSKPAQLVRALRDGGPALWARVLALIGIVTLGAGLYVWQTRGPSLASHESGYGASLIDPIQPADTQGLLPADGIRAIDDPGFLRPGSNAPIPDALPVIGISLNGESHAYPIPVLSVHEIVNDTLGGQNIAVTW